MSFKRKREPVANPVLKAAMMGGDPNRTSFVKKLVDKSPSIHNRLSQSMFFIPKGRSGIRHLMRQENASSVVHPRNKSHVHDQMRKYNRGKATNGIKSHIQSYAQ